VDADTGTQVGEVGEVGAGAGSGCASRWVSVDSGGCCLK
jgi:hypothetical protein